MCHTDKIVFTSLFSNHNARIVLPLLLTEFVKDVLLVVAEDIMKQPEKPFRCVECGNTGDMIWKTRNAKPTFVTTIFGSVSLPQIQKLRMFPWFLLDTDGDMSILKGIKGLNIIFQRCLW